MIFRVAIICMALTMAQTVQGQYKEPYVTSGMEIIFSKGGTSHNGNLRFAPVLNLQSNLNYDYSELLGVYTGLAVRNVGFIYDDPDPTVDSKKFRSYNVGIPIGIKVGNMDRAFIYGGYELELPFHYKEKTFVNEVKSKFSVWFSDRVNPLHHSVFFGFQFWSGMNVKFKYYLNDFHNRDYQQNDGTRPYADLKSNIFAVSLNFSVFRNAKFFYAKNKVDIGAI